MLTVCCVLRSGGDFDWRYVTALRHAVRKNLSLPYEFVCFSDLGNGLSWPLLRNWPGWWSKVEVFRLTGPCIYFDLDTVILSRVDALVEAVLQATGRNFWMLKPFRSTEQWASGVMAWEGDFRPLYEEFDPQKDIPRFRWDQRYITHRLQDQTVGIDPIQNHIPGIYSYKHHCRKGPPDDAQIICFHGKPRPHETDEPWVKEHWR